MGSDRRVRVMAAAQWAARWPLVIAGLAIGCCAVVRCSNTFIHDDSPLRQQMSTCWAAGFGLFGLLFWVASYLGIRSRKRAAVAFLLGLPVAIFCLAFPEAPVYYVKSGHEWVEWPNSDTAAVLTTAYLAPFYLALVAFRYRKTGVALFGLTATTAAAVLLRSEWTPTLLPSLVAWSAPLFLFALIWLATARLGWPPPVVALPRRPVRRLAAGLASLLLMCATSAILTMVSRARSSHLPLLPTPFVTFHQQKSPEHVAFVAKPVLVRHSGDWEGRWAGSWAIAVVPERFWGLPAWNPGLLLLVDGAFLEGETYYIEGDRPPGVLTRFLPMVEIHGHAMPVRDAEYHLRVLRHPPAPKEVLITGRVRRPQPLAPCAPRPEDCSSWIASDVHTRVCMQAIAHPPLAGCRLRLSNARTTLFATTDQQGVFRFEDVVPDDYMLEAINLPPWWELAAEPILKFHLTHQEVMDLRIELHWSRQVGVAEDNLPRAMCLGLPLASPTLRQDLSRADPPLWWWRPRR